MPAFGVLLNFEDYPLEHGFLITHVSRDK